MIHNDLHDAWICSSKKKEVSQFSQLIQIFQKPQIQNDSEYAVEDIQGTGWLFFWAGPSGFQPGVSIGDVACCPFANALVGCITVTSQSCKHRWGPFQYKALDIPKNLCDAYTG